MTEQFQNLSRSSLASSVNDSTLTWTVVDGSQFPASGVFRLNCGGELVAVASRSGDTLTLAARGIEGTTPAAHVSGLEVKLVVTKESLKEFCQQFSIVPLETEGNDGAAGSAGSSPSSTNGSAGSAGNNVGSAMGGAAGNGGTGTTGAVGAAGSAGAGGAITLAVAEDSRVLGILAGGVGGDAGDGGDGGIGTGGNGGNGGDGFDNDPGTYTGGAGGAGGDATGGAGGAGGDGGAGGAITVTIDSPLCFAIVDFIGGTGYAGGPGDDGESAAGGNGGNGTNADTGSDGSPGTDGSDDTGDAGNPGSDGGAGGDVSLTVSDDSPTVLLIVRALGANATDGSDAAGSTVTVDKASSSLLAAEVNAGTVLLGNGSSETGGNLIGAVVRPGRTLTIIGVGHVVGSLVEYNGTVLGEANGVFGKSQYVNGTGAIVGGLQHTVSGTGSTVNGVSNNVSGNGHLVAGIAVTVSGNYCFVIGDSISTIADHEMLQGESAGLARRIVRNLTTSNATLTSTTFALADNRARAFELLVTARDSGGDVAAWKITGVIKRGANAAATVIVGTPTVTQLAADSGASSWDVDVSANTSTGSLSVDVTGEAATDIKWSVVTLFSDVS